MNIKAMLRKNSHDSHMIGQNYEMENFSRKMLPIVYSPRYNISFCGLEKIHPFDS